MQVIGVRTSSPSLVVDVEPESVLACVGRSAGPAMRDAINEANPWPRRGPEVGLPVAMCRTHRRSGEPGHRQQGRDGVAVGFDRSPAATAESLVVPCARVASRSFLRASGLDPDDPRHGLLSRGWPVTATDLLYERGGFRPGRAHPGRWRRRVGAARARALGPGRRRGRRARPRLWRAWRVLPCGLTSLCQTMDSDLMSDTSRWGRRGAQCTAHDYAEPGKPRIAWDDPAAPSSSSTRSWVTRTPQRGVYHFGTHRRLRR